ncbi:MAG: helicase HerA-like domain-containing protein [Actinomycetota bacterium]
MDRPPGHLFVGDRIDADGGDRLQQPVLLDSADFTTHGVIVGMTGSGKTGLGVVLLEEALLAGIPVLAIDPKGDLANLCLTFPDLAPGDFEPWIDEGSARVQQKTVPEMAADTAALWSKGLGGWEMGGPELSALQAAADPIVYTPGSTIGVPLDVLGRLSAPSTDDPGARQDEVDATVSGLLSLVGVDSDPLSGREHILLANLITRAWDNGTDLDLPTLLGQLLDPPIRKLGVLDLDTFFPADDRQTLVLKLNGLLASPSFAAWAEGAPLDIEKMLWKNDGSARAAVVSLNHLEESERHFAVTLVLSKLISWMRTRSGTGELRVLVYIDEVMGYAPPVGNPPTKKPILTLLKQARAFGVGLVLSTQNPVDLDYKAISNAGTWMIGRLQTEQDKQRLVDGLRSADGSTDLAQVEATISNLDKRQFLLRTTRSPDLPLFTTRWAMSYLAGPLTGDQLTVLMADEIAALEAGSATAAAAPADGPTPPAPTAASGAPAPAAAAASTLAEDESTVAPEFPDSLPVRYASLSSPWLAEVGGDAEGDRLIPVLATRVELLFDETKAKLRHSQEWEAVIPLGADGVDVDTAIAVDLDDRDFSAKTPDGAVYVLPEEDVSASAVRSAKADLKAKLYQDLTLSLRHNASLKLWGRPGETAEAFAVRCEAAADEGADAEAEKIRKKLEAKHDKVLAALAKAEDRVAELEVQSKGRRNQQIIDIGSSVLGGLLGGRRSSRSLASAARRAASGRRQANSAATRLESARNRVAEKVEELDELEYDLQDALMEIDDEWSTKAADVAEVEIALEKSDIAVEDFFLAWIPTSR